MAVIKNNMSAKNTLNTLNRNSSALKKSLKKVSSGMKINSAADDASGYAISEGMRAQIRALDQADQNVQNATSMMRVAEGAVQSTVDILRTLKEKAINSANDTNTDADRATIQKEVKQLIDQVEDNANITFNGKYLFEGHPLLADESSDTNPAAEAMIVKGLNTVWLKQCLDLVEETYGLSFNDPGATVREINVVMQEEDTDTLAYVTNWAADGVDGTASKLQLTVNMKYYKGIDQNDPNGSSSSGQTYLDRVIAHELVHAVMAANITGARTLGKYIREGMAELVHGIDDQRPTTIKNLLKSPSTLEAVFAGTNDDGANAYAAGYVLFRYMAKQTGGSAAEVMKKFAGVLNTSGAVALDTAVSTASGGKYATMAALQTALLTDLGTTPSDAEVNTFLSGKCGIILDNADTGAATGSDAGSGADKTATSIVPEDGADGLPSSWKYPTSATTTVNGLKIIWPDGYVGTEAEEAKVGRAGGFYYQVGAKANQSIYVVLNDIHAKSLGLKNDEGECLQMTTRKKAQDAISVLDNALDYALDEQTNIGAVESRLAYTSSNLVTASENVQSAESVIRDADLAKEMANYTKHNVLMQAAQSMLAQANQSSSQVLSLLQ